MSDKLIMNEADMREFVTNVTGVVAARASLQQRLGQTYGGDRDIYIALGLTKNPTVSDLYGRWRRQGVARRVVRAMPDATWRVPPEIYDDADAQEETPFETRWKEITQNTRLWNRVARADRLAGVGEFAVVLLGTDDVKNEQGYQQPLAKAKDLVFVQVFGRWNVTVAEWVTETTDPQYGKPRFYELKAGQPGALLQGTGLAESSVSARQSNLKVHHSRVIHIADDVEEDDLMGTPRMLPVLNDLQMLELVAAGSAEMFWRGGFPGMALQMDAQARPLTDSEKSALNTTIENYVNGLERVMRLQGIEAKTLGGGISAPNPGPTCDALFQMISAGTGIPLRILTGSERGELASSQDSENWYSRVDERRANWAEGEIVRPFVQRMIDCGVLPKPIDNVFKVDWAKAVAATEAERVDIGSKRTTALASYASSGLMDVIAPADYFERFLAMSPEDAKTLADEAEERANATMEREQALMEEQAAAQAEAAVADEGGEAPPDDSTGIQFNAGTSEGAKEGWDKRGRGQKEETLAGKWAQTASRAEQHGGMIPVKYDKTAAKWMEVDSGKEAAQAVQDMKIPPSWEGVHASTDAQSKIAYVGIMPEARDKEGTLKREAQMKEEYSDAHIETQKAAKFARVSELASKQDTILEEVNTLRASEDKLTAECATVMKLIYHTGIRPGGPESDGTFGATTLQGRHVKPQEDGTVKLQFLGKDHVRQNVTVSDPVLVKELVARAQATGPKGKVFATSASSLRAFATELDGGGFKPKDFRTLRGTGEALKAIRAELGDKMKPFTDEGEYKKFTMKIAKQVSSILGNTPIVALQSYIDPHVFARLNPKHEGQD